MAQVHIRHCFVVAVVVVVARVGFVGGIGVPAEESAVADEKASLATMIAVDSDHDHN